MPFFADAAAISGGLTALDILVLAIYILAMLGMGLAIARRQKTTEDFFLGGRNLPAWAVGISLLASLLSTITYLGMPGEMFRSGIGFLTRQLAIPFVLIVVWFIWIPFFMRLNLTSAYEYLERRFDRTTRSLAASLCLLLIFGWISVVVLTASQAMVEITQLNLPWFLGTNIAATQKAADGSAQINPEDIRDWRTLASTIRRQGQAAALTPGKRIWEQLSPASRDHWPDADESQSVKDENLGFDPTPQIEFIATGLSEVLRHNDLFKRRYWQDVKLPSTTDAFLLADVDVAGFSAEDKRQRADAVNELPVTKDARLSPVEITQFNRLLIEAAFPQAIEKTHAQQRHADMHAIILAIGLFSVLYTTLGGIQAVVWTDVIQFIILIGGALFTMGYIAYSTESGLSDWLAASYQHKREEVEWISWDVGNRSTVAFIVLGMFFWFICTHGANQVALQRYFTLKSIWAARRSYLVSALASFALGVILAGVGISLMYFVQKHPEMPAASDLNSSVTSISSPAQDKVFPQFIRLYLPSGLRGLVVAALFAAAMSTIDSGANSVSTIVTIDFFRRYRRGKSNAPESDAKNELKVARMITASMGIIVVAGTILLYHLSQGTDLITLCQKGFNCFLGPLGALFVLGMFSSRCTARAVIPAIILGEIVGVATSYSPELFGLKFSTHLVIPASWLTTILAAHLFALVMRTRVSEEQRKLMWLPVVRSR